MNLYVNTKRTHKHWSEANVKKNRLASTPDRQEKGFKLGIGLQLKEGQIAPIQKEFPDERGG